MDRVSTCPKLKLTEVEMAFRSSSFGDVRAASMVSIIAFALLLCANAAHSQAPDTPNKHNGAPDSFADLAERVEPAVIGVTSKSAATAGALPERFMPGRRAPKRQMPDADGPDTGPATAQAVSIGSGFFISADGYAVTNSHVMEGSDTAEIRTSDNKVYQARLIGNDPLSDLALIKVDGRSDFSYVKLADQPPRVGDWISR
jgi:serine protease Do